MIVYCKSKFNSFNHCIIKCSKRTLNDMIKADNEAYFAVCFLYITRRDEDSEDSHWEAAPFKIKCGFHWCSEYEFIPITKEEVQKMLFTEAL